MKTNSKYLNQLFLERNIKKSTRHLYIIAWNHYCELHKLSADELINETAQEEIERIPHFQMKIKERLIQYRQYLQDKNYKPGSINKFVSLVISTYNHFELWTPNNIKQIPVEQKDAVILPKEDIRQALSCTNNLTLQAVILTILSGGFRLSDLVNIQVKDFINATSKYHHSSNIYDAYNEMKYKDDIIPQWHIQTVKTRKRYHTFSSPESTKKILQMLKQRMAKETIHEDDKLFNTAKETVSQNIKHLNNNMGWGKVGTYAYLRCHNLRKTFSTILAESNVDPNCRRLMLSHSINKLDITYVNYSVELLYKEYLKALPHLLIYSEVDVISVSDSELEEFERIKSEYKLLKEEMDKIKQLLTLR